MPTINDDDVGHTLDGSGDADTISGNGGDDVIHGFEGDDLLDGGLGADFIDGGAGIDTVSYQWSTFLVEVDLRIAIQVNMTPSIGQDTLLNVENLIGSETQDSFIGNAENNVLEGRGGVDILYGGDGDDTLDGGSGNDFAKYTTSTAGVTVSTGASGPQNTIGAGIDTLISIENLEGSEFADHLSGAAILRGDGGDDVLISLAGGSTHTITGGTGDDMIVSVGATENIDGESGTDTVSFANFSGGIDLKLDGNGDYRAGAVNLDNVEIIIATALNDKLSPASGVTQIYGGGGDDSFTISPTNNTRLDGGGGTDTLTINASTGSVTIDLSLAGDQVSAGVLVSIENVVGSTTRPNTLSGDEAANFLAGGVGADTLNGRAGDDVLQGAGGADQLDGGAGFDTADYSNANTGVSVDLSLTGSQNTAGGGFDTLASVEGLTGSRFADGLYGTNGDNILSGGDGADILQGRDGNDILSGGDGSDGIDGGELIDTAVFSGNRSQYTITTNGFTATVVGPDGGQDTLTNVEYFRFDDQTYHWTPGNGQAINLNTADPDSYMAAIRDFSGNNLGAATDWVLVGHVDVQGDGDQEYIYTNQTIGRWATIGPDGNGLVHFEDYHWTGDTRVVGIYIDPLMEIFPELIGTPVDSQARFQSDLQHGNIGQILGAGDYDHDGLQEVYFALADGTAYIHAYMHADGNIRYANYQNQQQVIDYLTGNGFGSGTYAGWFN